MAGCGLRRAYGEGLWESICHPLQINHMRVFAMPSRLIVAAYAFMVLVFSNTYLVRIFFQLLCAFCLVWHKAVTILSMPVLG